MENWDNNMNELVNLEYKRMFLVKNRFLNIADITLITGKRTLTKHSSA